MTIMLFMHNLCRLMPRLYHCHVQWPLSHYKGSSSSLGVKPMVASFPFVFVMSVAILIITFASAHSQILHHKNDSPSSSTTTTVKEAVEVEVAMAVEVVDMAEVVEEVVEHLFLMPFLGSSHKVHYRLYLAHYIFCLTLVLYFHSYLVGQLRGYIRDFSC